MSFSESFASSVNNGIFGNIFADDGTVSRIRDGQNCTITAFGDLAVPAGATINGIQIIMEGYAGTAGHDASTGHWIHVSNDNGSSWSTATSVITGNWSTNSGMHEIETAGGLTELWGKSWTASTANAIQVKLEWSTTNSEAVYLDYVKIRIYYTGGNKSLSVNGLLTVNGQLTIK